MMGSAPREGRIASSSDSGVSPSRLALPILAIAYTRNSVAFPSRGPHSGRWRRTGAICRDDAALAYRRGSKVGHAADATAHPHLGSLFKPHNHVKPYSATEAPCCKPPQLKKSPRR